METDRWACGTSDLLYHAHVNVGRRAQDVVLLWLCLDCVRVYCSSDELLRVAGADANECDVTGE